MGPLGYDAVLTISEAIVKSHNRITNNKYAPMLPVFSAVIISCRRYKFKKQVASFSCQPAYCMRVCLHDRRLVDIFASNVKKHVQLVHNMVFRTCVVCARSSFSIQERPYFSSACHQQPRSAATATVSINPTMSTSLSPPSVTRRCRPLDSS